MWTVTGWCKPSVHSGSEWSRASGPALGVQWSSSGPEEVGWSYAPLDLFPDEPLCSRQAPPQVWGKYRLCAQGKKMNSLKFFFFFYFVSWLFYDQTPIVKYSCIKSGSLLVVVTSKNKWCSTRIAHNLWIRNLCISTPNLVPRYIFQQKTPISWRFIFY